MRAIQICSEFTYPATAITTASAAVLLAAANVGSVYAGQEATPGEDMAFPTTGSCVAAIELEGVTSTAGDTINVQASQNYYAVSGSSPTYVTTKTATLPALTTKSKTIFLDRVGLGEAVRISITAVGAIGVGTVSAYLLSE